MGYELVLSQDSINDIDKAFNYYNGISLGLGFEFTDTLDKYFKNISNLPTASAIRYDLVRVKAIDTFPFTIHFTISEKNQIIILRIFNTHQQPFW